MYFEMCPSEGKDSVAVELALNMERDDKIQVIMQQLIELHPTLPQLLMLFERILHVSLQLLSQHLIMTLSLHGKIG